jgi:hypothetical protein
LEQIVNGLSDGDLIADRDRRDEIMPTYGIAALARAGMAGLRHAVEVAGRCVNRIGLFKVLHHGVPW